MSGFVAAALALLAITLALLLWPLWPRRARARDAGDDAGARIVGAYRGELAELESDRAAGTLAADAFEQSRRELQARLLRELDAVGAAAPPAAAPGGGQPRRAALLALAAFVVAAPTVLYLVFGRGALEAANAGTAVATTADGQTITAEQIDAMIGRLQAHLKDEPGDGKGWTMLARSFNVLGRYPDAADAYEHALALAPNDAQLLADDADAVAMAQGRSLAGKPMALVERALKLDPANAKALALAGSFAFESRNFALAIDLWQRAQRSSGQDTEFSAALAASIAEARQRGGVASAEPAPAAAPQVAGTPAAGAASVRGRVTLAGSLAGKASGDDTVFVFARAEQGPRMPVALLRRQVKDLPLDFTLDDSSAMMPQLALSKFARVIVGARVSKSGDATPHSGDLRGEAGPVDVGSDHVDVKISEVVP